MVTKYYVAIRPQTNDYHSVHKENCPFLPDDKKRIYLGQFDSGHDAIKEGKRHFDKTKCCLFCLKEHYHEVIKPAVCETYDCNHLNPPGERLRKRLRLTILIKSEYKPAKKKMTLHKKGPIFYFLN
jgi:hypothetical protein